MTTRSKRLRKEISPSPSPSPATNTSSTNTTPMASTSSRKRIKRQVIVLSSSSPSLNTLNQPAPSSSSKSTTTTTTTTAKSRSASKSKSSTTKKSSTPFPPLPIFYEDLEDAEDVIQDTEENNDLTSKSIITTSTTTTTAAKPPKAPQQNNTTKSKSLLALFDDQDSDEDDDKDDGDLDWDMMVVQSKAPKPTTSKKAPVLDLTKEDPPIDDAIEEIAQDPKQSLSKSSSTTKRNPSSKKFVWKMPSADSFAVPDPQQTSTTTSTSPSTPTETRLWIDKHQPTTESDTAVHKKKIAEVRAWLTTSLDPALPFHRKPQRILVLTGPSGAGKTAVIRMLANELGFEILEWLNPVNSNEFTSKQNNEERYYDRNNPSSYQSLALKFHDFLTRADKYPSLSFNKSQPITFEPNTNNNNPRKIVLIEDIPNLSNHSTRTSFQTEIKNYVFSTRSRYPLIFILSDTNTRSSIDEITGRNNFNKENDKIATVRTVIPQELLHSVYCSTIHFNPVAPTYLVKALIKICDVEFSKQKSTKKNNDQPPKDYLEAIAQNSGGDIRCAINALQFLTIKPPDQGYGVVAKVPAKGKRKRGGSQDVVVKTLTPLEKEREKKKRKKELDGMLDCISRREISGALFHSLGKILYNKRAEELDEELEASISQPLITASTEPITLPPHLLTTHTRTPRLIHSPEQLFKNTYTDAELFNLFLFQNYPPFFQETEEIETALAYMSDADILLGNWTTQSYLSPYATSITSRGLLFAHTNPVPKQSHFRAFYKPDLFKVSKTLNERSEQVKDIIGEFGERFVNHTQRDDTQSQPPSSRSLWAPHQQSPWHGSAHFSDKNMTLEILPYMSLMHPQRTSMPPFHTRNSGIPTTWSKGLLKHQSQFLMTLSRFTRENGFVGWNGGAGVVSEKEPNDLDGDLMTVDEGGEWVDKEKGFEKEKVVVDGDDIVDDEGW